MRHGLPNIATPGGAGSTSLRNPLAAPASASAHTFNFGGELQDERREALPSFNAVYNVPARLASLYSKILPVFACFS